MTRLKHLALCVILLIGGAAAADQERKLVRREEPAYPNIAARMNLHGVRRLEYIGGHPLLAESALKAVKAWKYEAYARESTSIVEVRF